MVLNRVFNKTTNVFLVSFLVLMLLPMAFIQSANAETEKPQVVSHLNTVWVLKADGTIWGWGANGGQLGDGTTIDRSKPVQVRNITNAKSLKTTNTSVFVVEEDGTLWAWGDNRNGILGDGTTTDRDEPVRVLENVKMIETNTGGYSVYAVKEDGTLWAIIGSSSEDSDHRPVQTLSNVKSVEAIADDVYAIKEDGTVWGWGTNDGHLGDGTTTGRSWSEPVQIGSISNAIDVYGNGSNRYILCDDGSVWAWGENKKGQVGDGTTVDKLSPVKVDISGVKSLVVYTGIYPNNETVLVLKEDGTVWGWGENSFGQIGDGTVTDRHSPVQTVEIENVIKLQSYHETSNTGYSQYYATKSDGTIWAWGGNSRADYSPQIGFDNGDNKVETPIQIPQLKGSILQDINSDFPRFGFNGESVWAWSDAGNGNTYLGNGTTNGSVVPVQIENLSGSILIHELQGPVFLSLKADGTVWVWGNDRFDYGLLTDESIDKSAEPIQVMVDDQPFLWTGGSDGGGTEDPGSGLASQNATVNIESGGFNLTALGESINFGTIPSPTANRTLTSRGVNFDVEDLRGTGEGWHVSVSAEPFESAEGKQFPAGSMTMNPPTISVNGDSTSELPQPISEPFMADSGSSIEVASAAVNEGMGGYHLAFDGEDDVRLNVPASAFAGTYQTTLNWQLVTAP